MKRKFLSILALFTIVVLTFTQVLPVCFAQDTVNVTVGIYGLYGGFSRK